MKFKEYKKLDLIEINEQVLEKWQRESVFKRSLELRAEGERFVFFEGPPSANGMPGIHHVMSRAIKDVICRYKSQSGYFVERKAGWDTHGLPVELSVEKSLGITKEDIGKKISIEDYNDVCRKEVMKYTREWESLTERVGYWVDMDHPYVTYKNTYIETLWFLLKDIYKKGYLYKGFSIQPYSPAAGTGLSSHELNQPGAYKDVKDTTAVVQFEVVKNSKSERFFEDDDTPLYFLAWTTTPWTLPSNTALAVGPAIKYLRVRSYNPYNGKPAIYIVAQDLLYCHFNKKAEEIALEDYKTGDKLIPFEVVGEAVAGKDLEGISYEQLIPWVKPDSKAFVVVTGDFVTTEDGTGVVHIAPTFGADDARVGKANGVEGLMVTDRTGAKSAFVDRRGRMFPIEDMDPGFVERYVDVDLYAPFSGKFVKNSYDSTLTESDETLDLQIALDLKQRGQAFKIEKHTHSYPHCWRTDKPVLYYPLDSWFIKSTAVRDRMIELNNTINWKPESTGTGRFGKWLENLQDWNLSRSRYWGTPLPIWRSEDGSEERCIGSVRELYDEIERSVEVGFMDENPLKLKGFDPEDRSEENYEKIDLHRPYVDQYILVSDSGKRMYRESDLIDVWFDSGAMPYAQEGLAKLGTPEFGQTADFIAEGVDQTRGWFFTLHAINTMVSDKVAFKNVISNGLVLDKDGNKMSKRLNNGIDPFDALDKHGADALRWYMITNSQPWDNLKFDFTGVDEVKRKFFGTLYNTYSFFALYANVDGFDNKYPQVPMERRAEIDRWIISLMNSLIRDVVECYENYDITNAGRKIQEFVCDHLSNWYVRLNRKRFWGGEMDEDKISAYQTLYSALENVAILAAPIAPFYMETIFCDLNSVSGLREEGSVHYSLMPQYNENHIDKDLEERMDLAQISSSMVLALRRKVNIKVRQPLAKIIVPVLDNRLKEQFEKIESLVLGEVNVKEVEFITDTTGLITKKIKPNFKTLGKKYGKQMKEIAGAFADMGQQEIASIEGSDSYTLALESGPVLLSAEDYEITSEDMPGWLVASEGKLTVALDITITDDLRREGVARELINRIQNIRKDQDFDVTDKIRVTIEDREDVRESLGQFSDYVASQTLARGIEMKEGLDEGAEVEWEGDGTIVIRVEKCEA